MKESLDTLAALAGRAMFHVDEAEKDFNQAWLDGRTLPVKSKGTEILWRMKPVSGAARCIAMVIVLAFMPAELLGEPVASDSARRSSAPVAGSLFVEATADAAKREQSGRNPTEAFALYPSSALRRPAVFFTEAPCR